MGRPRITVDENFVKKHQNKFAQKWAKYVIHESLKCGGSIGEAKRHYKELVVARVSAKGSFMDISSRHADLVISRFEIQLAKPMRPM